MEIGALTATLGVDSSGLRKAEGDLRSFGSTANSTFGSAGSAASSCASQLAAVAGVTLSLVGAFSLAQKAVSSWYSLVSGGISIVDDYQKKIISTSYILTTMSDVKPPDLSKAYGEWKGYFDWLYRESLRVDKMAAASGQDIFNVSIEMAKKGVVAASEEEMNTIGRLTDLMKAVTPGYMNFEQQARGEIMAMMEGTARMGAQTAQILSQIDPAFKKNILAAREQGTVLKYIESILPQIKQYTLDLMGTWDAVGASLKSAWSVINLSAFAGAHREVVALATELSNRLVDNGRLTADGEKAAKALGEAWSVAKDYISEAMNYILDNSDTIIGKIEAIVSVMGRVTGVAIDIGIGFLNIIDSVTQFAMNVQVGMVNVRAAIGYTIDWFQIMGTAIKDVTVAIIMNFSDIAPAVAQAYASMGVSSAYWANAAIQDANAVRGAVLGAMQATRNVPPALQGIFGTPLPTAIAPPPGPTAAPNVPGVRPFTGKEPKGKGGGGGDGGAFAEAGRLASLFDTLTKDIARLSEGKLSEIEANYIKTVDQIYKKTEVRAVSEAEVEILAKTRATLQKAKLQDDFDLKMAKDSGDVFLSIQKDYEKDLSDFNGLAGAKEKTEANRAKRELDARIKFQEQVFTMQSASLSALASAVPLLSQQLPIEKSLLDIELKRGDLKMEEELRVLKINHMISAGQEDELRQLKALENQYKRYAQERKGWMLEGVSGGLKAGSLDRGKEAETRTAQWTIDAMKGAETWLGETGGQAFVDTLHGKKQDLMKMFQDIGDSLVKQLFKMGTTKLFDSVWGAFAGPGAGKLGTDSNPMVVRIHGGAAGGLGPASSIDRSIQKAGKVGMTVHGGGALGDWSDDMKGLKTYDKLYDQMIKGQTKDWKMTNKLSDNFWKDSKKDATTYSKMQDDLIGQNQELFKADYLTTYQDSFTGMATGITGVWGTAQGLMTAAGVSGDAARLMSLGGYAMQGIGIIQKMAKGTILADASRAAAAAFAWMVELIPPPGGEIAGAIAAAVAFSAISAYGMFGGDTAGIASSAGGDFQVGGTGPRLVHQDETILPVWAANSWRDIVSRENMGGGGRPGENGDGQPPIVFSPTYHVNAIDARGVEAVLQKHGKAMVKIINQEIGKRGRNL